MAEKKKEGKVQPVLPEDGTFHTIIRSQHGGGKEHYCKRRSPAVSGRIVGGGSVHWF